MKKTVSLSTICQVVAEYFECEQIDIFDTSRKREIIRRRQWFHYLARTLSPKCIVSSIKIGQYYSDVTGRKIDHATVLHSTKKIKGYIEIYAEYYQLESLLQLKIKEETNLLYQPPESILSTPIGNYCNPTPLNTELKIKTRQSLYSQNQ